MDQLIYLQEGKNYLEQLDNLTNRLNEILYVSEQTIFETLRFIQQDLTLEENITHLRTLSECIHFILLFSRKLNQESSDKLKKVIEDYEKFVVNGKKELFIERIKSGCYEY